MTDHGHTLASTQQTFAPLTVQVQRHIYSSRDKDRALINIDTSPVDLVVLAEEQGTAWGAPGMVKEAEARVVEAEQEGEEAMEREALRDFVQ